MTVLAAYAVPHPPLAVPGVAPDELARIGATVAAYREVARRVAEHGPEALVVSSPHAEAYLDYLHVAGGPGARGSMARFGAPGERHEVAYDERLVARLCELADAEGLPVGTAGERSPELDHGTLVPLHFLREAWEARWGAHPLPPLVRMGISGLSPLEHYRVGALVARAARELGRRVVWVASGDLSHRLLAEGPYGFDEEGPRFDEAVCAAFETGDFLALLTMDPALAERAGECGLRSFQLMAGALDRTPVSAELLSHEGPFGVGYGVAAFEVTGPAGSAPGRDFGAAWQARHERDLAERREREDPWVRLARLALEGRVRDGTRPDARALLDRMSREGRLDEEAAAELAGTRAGCFVSLKKDGQLRGCIGTLAPTRASLAEEVCANAVSAGLRDPRFPPVAADELGELVYDVDVLGEPEEVAGPGELDCLRWGVIVSSADGTRRGVLLPDLDGVDTVEEQLRIAARKGGVDLAEEGVRVERFEVARHL